MKDYDNAVAFLGQWGRFQLIFFFLLCSTIVPNGFGAFTLIFLTDVPSHQCLVSDTNITEDWHKSIIPVKMVNGKPELSSCSRYRLDVVRNLSALGYIPGRDVNLTDLEQENCVDGWSYSKDIYESTVVSEFDLVCSDQWKRPFTTLIFFLGVVFGSFFSGQLSDRYGRKLVLFVTMAVQTVFVFVQAFATSWVVFIILLFINGLAQINYLAALVLGAEVLTGNERIFFSSLGSCLAFAIGYMMLPLFAYFLRDWKSLLYALSVPSVVFVPESPRWLISQGRVEEAEAILRKAAKWNKVQAPNAIFEDCSAEQRQIFCSKFSSNFATIYIFDVARFSLCAGYFGLSFNAAQLSADPYISCFLAALVEIPAYISSWVALRYLPRRLSLIGCFLLGALPLFFIQLVPENLSNLSLTLELVGKYAFTTGISLIFAYVAELYPTVLRNTATGICMAVSRIGSCVSPFVLNLRVYFTYLPYIILGSLAVLSAFATLFLPESFKQPLPETIQQQKLQGWCICWKPDVCSSSKNVYQHLPFNQ
uniref:Major facilitator superfamily (MFS) profile domain-containing protein n=1 Tax=Amphiprion percula TaxID=161767 RepID=A0A3P8TXY5_AMPPE